MKAIELKNVSFRYPNNNIEVLKDVSLSIEYGKIALIAGSSGSGKSTLFHIMNGIMQNAVGCVLTGEVLVNGASIAGKSIGVLSASVGSVLQNAEAQIINGVVKDEVAFGLENTAVESSKMNDIITAVCADMSLNTNAKTATLSGGEKQRLITATTLALKAKIIILDEPLANLDKSGAEMLMDSLKKLAQAGYAVVVIEHRLDMLRDYVDVLYSVQEKCVQEVRDISAYLAASTAKIAGSESLTQKDKPAIEIKNVSYEKKGCKILNNITITINKGERIVLLGDNGAGKSTLTKMMLRLIKPTTGAVVQHIDGKIGQRANKKWFKKVAYVFQNPNYQLFMPTVEEELLFSAHSLEYCQQIVDKFELEPLLDRHPQSLSEGQKRKVGVATMLAMKPDIIVLDEPTVGQDYKSLKKLVDIINEINREQNTTIITITHDTRCASALCDRALLISGGSLVEASDKGLISKYFNI
ncbi:MAG: ABC transporter ATP-binding protein [Bacillota bacterium]